MGGKDKAYVYACITYFLKPIGETIRIQKTWQVLNEKAAYRKTPCFTGKKPAESAHHRKHTVDLLRTIF